MVEADGFVSKTADGGYEGYIIEMIEAVAASAGFTYNLKSPSGFGANCSPQLAPDATEGVGGAEYASSFLCGQDDTLTAVPEASKTDMYWSIFFVTDSRQEAGKFSLPFKPPFGGLTMYGVATGISDIEDLVAQQAAGGVGPACVGAGTAYANFLASAFPDLDTVAVPNTDAGFLDAMNDGTCTVAINAEPQAFRFVKNRSTSDTCEVDGMPIGVIGDSLKYGLTQMAVGFGKDADQEVVDAISYHLNTLMTCVPGSEGCDGSLFASWEEWAGVGDECGYENVADVTDGSSRNLMAGGAVVLGALSMLA